MNNKEDSFSDYLKIESFFLLIKPEYNIYSNTYSRHSFFAQLESLVKLGLKNIDFIAAGGLSINDLKTCKSLGYKAIVIGDKAFKNKKFDPKIFEWLKNN